MQKSIRLVAMLGVLAALAFMGTQVPSARAQDTVDTVAIFRGTASGRVITHSVYLQPGLVVVRARHSGNSNIILSLTLPKPGVDIRHEYEDSIGMINAVGPYNGAAAARINRPGLYVVDLFASGGYQVTIEQPTFWTAVPVHDREFVGRGQQVTPAVALPAGPVRLTFTHDGTSNFQVWLYDMEGATAGGDVFGRLVNVIGPSYEAVTLALVLDGTYLFAVNADGNWTIHIE